MRLLVLLVFPLLLAPAGNAHAVQKPDLEITPDTGLVDQPVGIRGSGLGAGGRVVFTATLILDSTRALESQAVYHADWRGEVDLSRLTSEAGTYTGVDAMGLFWSGRIIARDSLGPELRDLLPLAAPAPYQVAIVMRTADGTVVQRRVLRRFVGPEVRMLEIRDSGLVGRLFLPSNLPARGVIVVSGSEGGYESSSLDAGLLASHGFVVLALAYFGAPGLPEELVRIPLEYVQRGIHWLGRRREVRPGGVALMGGSKGAELVLVAGSMFAEVRAVVAYAPTLTVGHGLTRNGGPSEGSSWTWRGKELPMLESPAPPEALAQFRRPDPVRLRLINEPALLDSAAVARAVIPVERIRGAVLLVSGTDDQMGPSDIAGDMIMDRLKRAGHGYPDLHLKYPGAGHQIMFPYLPTTPRLIPWRFAVGGTSEAYAHADADSWPRVLRFLEANLH